MADCSAISYHDWNWREGQDFLRPDRLILASLLNIRRFFLVQFGFFDNPGELI